MIEWVGTCTDWQFEIEGIVDAGDDCVALLYRERRTRQDQREPMSQRGVMVNNLRDGLIVSRCRLDDAGVRGPNSG